MAIGDPLSNDVPAVGAAGTGYATSVNALLTEIKTLLEQKIPFTSLEGAELDLENVPILDAEYVQLYEGGLPAATPIGRLARYQNNLYWVTDEGAVRITNGGALDSTSLGGITGDFGTPNLASVEFIDAGQRYDFFDLPDEYAYLRCKGVDISDGASEYFGKIRYSSAAAADITFTLPTALPASNRSVLVIGADGQIEANDSTDTITNAIRCGANVNIHLSGTGALIHGEREFTVTLNSRQEVSGVWSSGGCNGMGVQSTTAGQAYFHIHGMQVGWKLKAVKVTTNKTSTGTTTVQILSGSFGNTVSFGSNTDATAGDRTITVTSTDTSSWVTGQGLTLLITTGNNNDKLFQAGIVFEQSA